MTKNIKKFSHDLLVLARNAGFTAYIKIEYKSIFHFEIFRSPRPLDSTEDVVGKKSWGKKIRRRERDGGRGNRQRQGKPKCAYMGC